MKKTKLLLLLVVLLCSTAQVWAQGYVNINTNSISNAKVYYKVSDYSWSGMSIDEWTESYGNISFGSAGETATSYYVYLKVVADPGYVYDPSYQIYKMENTYSGYWAGYYYSYSEGTTTPTEPGMPGYETGGTGACTCGETCMHAGCTCGCESSSGMPGSEMGGTGTCSCGDACSHTACACGCESSGGMPGGEIHSGYETIMDSNNMATYGRMLTGGTELGEIGDTEPEYGVYYFKIEISSTMTTHSAYTPSDPASYYNNTSIDFEMGFKDAGWKGVLTDDYTDYSASSGRRLTITKTEYGNGVMEDFRSSYDSSIYDEMTSTFKECFVSPWKDNTDITVIDIQEGITHVGDYAFYGCSNVSTASNAMSASTSNSSYGVAIPSSVTSIGQYAFANMTNTLQFVIPANVETIGEHAFDTGSYETRNFLVLGETPASLGENAFGSSNSNLTIYVPKDKENAYKSAWTAYADNIQGIELTVSATSLKPYASQGDSGSTIYYNGSDYGAPGLLYQFQPYDNDNNSYGFYLVGTELTKDVDYTIACKKGDETVTEIKDAGDYTIEVTGKGKFTGSNTLTLTISPRDISNVNISNISKQEYTGSAIEPTLTVNDYGISSTPELGTDYTVAYSNNTDAGSATVTLTGQGNYTSTKNAYFVITKSLTHSDITIDIPSQEYTGQALTPTITFKDDTQEKSAGYYTYSVSMNSGSNMIEPGTYDIRFYNNSDNWNYQNQCYTGERTETFTISKRDLANVTVAAIEAQEYTDTAVEPELTLTNGTQTLVLGTDYTVEYSDNTAAGTGHVTITGAGDHYTGSITRDFNIFTKTVNGGTELVDNGTTVTLTIEENNEKTGGVIPVATGETSVTVSNLTYTRTLATSDDAYTVCLPYTPPTAEGIKYYTLASANGTILNFTEETSPVANTPYLVLVTSDTQVGQTLYSPVTLNTTVDATATAGNYVMKGTLTGIANADAQGFYILQSANRWGMVDSNDTGIYVPPFRAYITMNSSSPAPILGMTIGNATGISTLRAVDSDGTEHYFDLNGRKLAGKPTKNGMYIVNGKKQIVNK